MRVRTLFWGAVALIAVVGGFALGDDLQERVERLRREGHYDLASELLQDHVDRGAPLTRDLAWLRAELTTDPDRFDRLAAELTSGKDAADPFVQQVVLARAQEYFARGRYVSAVELLQALPNGDTRVLTEAALYQGMASSAAGSAREARERFLLIPASSPDYPMAQTLLAELSLRTGDLKAALQYAESALSTRDSDIAPQALYARAQALDQQGEGERAERTFEEIVRNWPRSAEAAWVREARLQAARGGGVDTASIPEEDAPEQRRGFALQLGAFHDRSLALRLARVLDGKAEELRIERDLTVSPPWYRVVSGNFTTRTSAENARTRLAEKGFDAVILAPGQG
jgi:tetratricopeptide (TPR) repeat protein